MEEVEEEFELIEQHERDEVEEVVLLIIDCVGDSVGGFAASIQPYFAFHVHISFAAASAADQSA